MVGRLTRLTRLKRLKRLMPARLLAGSLVAGATAAGCSLPYPVPAGNAADPPPAGPARPDPDWSGAGCATTLRQEALERINALRERHGLPALRPHAELVRPAQAHTEEQAARGRVTHDGADGSAVGDRVERSGYDFTVVGENVAGGYGSAAEVVAGWLDSPGHRAILLAPDARHAGLGYAYRADGRLRHFWTLVVAAPAPTERTDAVRCHP